MSSHIMLHFVSSHIIPLFRDARNRNTTRWWFQRFSKFYPEPWGKWSNLRTAQIFKWVASSSTREPNPRKNRPTGYIPFLSRIPLIWRFWMTIHPAVTSCWPVAHENVPHPKWKLKATRMGFISSKKKILQNRRHFGSCPPENERISPEKGPLQKEIHLPRINFQGIFVRFQGEKKHVDLAPRTTFNEMCLVSIVGIHAFQPAFLLHLKKMVH